MLQAHSLLWHYLWVAPNVYLLLLAVLLSRRDHTGVPKAFLFFSFVAPLAQLAVYFADVIPSVAPATFWHVLWSDLVISALVKFVLIGELFVGIFTPYASIAKMGKILIRAIGAGLVFVATLVALFTPVTNVYVLVSGPHILEQTIFIIESGLLLFIFVFAAYFGLRPNRKLWGISLGLAISAFVHLATWALAAGNLSKQVSVYLDFVNMATFHSCILLWYYYLLVPDKKRQPPRQDRSESSDSSSTDSLGSSTTQEHDQSAQDWNRELERLIHQ